MSSDNPSQDSLNFENALSTALDQDALAESLSRSPDRQSVKTLTPFDQGGGYSVRSVDLSTLSDVVSLGLPQHGYAIQYLYSGSTPGGRIVINEQTPIYPGQIIYGFSEKYLIRRAKTDEFGVGAPATSGTALLVFWTRPDAQIRELLPDPSIGATLLANVNLVGGTGIYYGKGGTTNVNPALIEPIDVREFTAIQFSHFITGYVGGAVPVGVLSLLHYDGPAISSNNVMSSSITVPNAGGGAILQTGEQYPGITNTGVAFINGVPVTSVYIRAQWIKFIVTLTGGATDVTAPSRVTLNGYRR
jgi:hypothetical protein